MNKSSKFNKSKIIKLIMLILFFLVIWIVYFFNFKKTFLLKSVSSDNEYIIEVYKIGNPDLLGSTYHVLVCINGDKMFNYTIESDFLASLSTPDIKWYDKNHFILSSRGDADILYLYMVLETDNYTLGWYDNITSADYHNDYRINVLDERITYENYSLPNWA